MATRGNLTLVASAEPEDGFRRAMVRLNTMLVEHCLVGTFARFRLAGLGYRFPPPKQAYPASVPVAVEDPNRNTALLFCVDGTLPPSVRKHFRLRNSNQVSWRNIRRLLPDADIEDYRTTHNRIVAPECRALLHQLLPLDYALLVERPLDEAGEIQPSELTHLHVKVERITDNAIRDLGRQLGYIQRSLFERGEDYVEALEAKFFEYHGFAAHASGRQAAAAMAAQLLRHHAPRFSVFVASQESGRLTVLTEKDTVTQYLLVEADDRLLARIGPASVPHYVVPGGADAPGGAVLRLRLNRTTAALPQPRRNRDADIMAPWLEIAAQEILPLPHHAADPLPYDWAEA
jgi:hypothetical protein